MCAGLLSALGLFDEMPTCCITLLRVLDVWSSKNLDTQEDYWDKIGTFWNIDYIGSRHAVSPKLGLSGPRTNINCF